jgi:hypothetical protein
MDGEDDGDNRANKMENSKDGNRKTIVFQFSFVAAIFIGKQKFFFIFFKNFFINFLAYFVVDYLLEVQFLDNIRLTYNHLQLVS